jgi:AMMECR1 domain-containing protein
MRSFWLMLVLSILMTSPGLALPLEPFRNDHALARQAHRLASTTAETYLAFGTIPTLVPSRLDRRLRAAGGAFVTLVSEGRVRGCWGSVHPQTPSLAQEIQQATVRALREDYRHHPVTRREWPDLQIYVSLVGPLEPLEGPADLSPKRDGLFVTTGGKGGVLLPGEGRTSTWMVAECRRKASLGPREPASMFRFPTLVFGPESEKP